MAMLLQCVADMTAQPLLIPPNLTLVVAGAQRTLQVARAPMTLPKMRTFARSIGCAGPTGSIRAACSADRMSPMGRPQTVGRR